MRSSRSPRDETGAVSGVANLPAQLSEPVSQGIRLLEIPRSPSFLTLLHQLLRLRVGLDTLVWLGEGAEADELQHLGELSGCDIPRNPPPIGFADQLECLSECPGRVEVVSKCRAERLGSRPTA